MKTNTKKSRSWRKKNGSQKDAIFENHNQENLWLSHLKEIAGKNAEALGGGGTEAPTFVSSKTDKGTLTSTINPKTQEVSHTWNRLGF
jgi:hypothetical protein